jgi:ATP-binding cassette subfamily B protein
MRQPFRSLLPCIRREGRVVCVALGLMALQVGLALLVPLGNKALIDAAIPGRDVTQAAVILGAMGIALLARRQLLHAQERLTTRVGARATARLRNQVHAKLHELPVGELARMPAAEVSALLAEDGAAVESAAALHLPKAAYLGLKILAYGVTLFSVEPRLALVAWVSLALAARLACRGGRRAVAETGARRAFETELLSVAAESHALQATIRALGLRGWNLRRFAGRLRALTGRSAKSQLRIAVMETSAVLAMHLVQLLVLGCGAFLAIAGQLSLGSLVAGTAIIRVIAAAVLEVCSTLPMLVRAAAALRTIERFLARPASREDATGLAVLPPLACGLRCERVSFAYPGGSKRVLDGLDLEVPAGATVAVVGPNGAGKSTLIELLLRHHEPAGGAIVVDGRDLRTATAASWRAQLAVVPQDPQLFDLTIRENLRLARPDATDAEVEEAARRAGADDSIRDLPLGFDTRAGERGAALSFALRQRIAIARAILRDPAVLLLDEATSALDAEAEAAVLAALKAPRRTTIAVTHRLAAAVAADRIVVVAAGRVVASGTHDELLARCGRYRALWIQQNGTALAGANDRGALTRSSGTRADATPPSYRRAGTRAAPRSARWPRRAGIRSRRRGSPGHGRAPSARRSTRPALRADGTAATCSPETARHTRDARGGSRLPRADRQTTPGSTRCGGPSRPG